MKKLLLLALIMITVQMPVAMGQNLAPIIKPLLTNTQASPTPAPTPAPENADNDNDWHVQDTFGTLALNKIIETLHTIPPYAHNFAENFVALSAINSWVAQQYDSSTTTQRWREAGIAVLLYVVFPFLGMLLTDMILAPWRRRAGERKLWSNAKLTSSCIRLGLMLISLAFFIATSSLLIDHYTTSRFVRFICLSTLYALAAGDFVIVVLRFILAPHMPAIRLIPISGKQALYTLRWGRVFSFIIICGYFLMDMARTVRVPAPAVNGFSNLIGLAVIMMTITIILQRQKNISLFLRGRAIDSAIDLSPWQGMRLWFSRSWHSWTIAYLIISYFITAMSIENGLNIILRGTLLTMVVLIAVRLTLYAISRWEIHHPIVASGAVFHRSLLRFLLRIEIWIVAILIILASWGWDVMAWFASPWGQIISGAGFSIGGTIIALTVTYEIINIYMLRTLRRYRLKVGGAAGAARMETILPMIHHTLVFIFCIILFLVILSSLGLNIGTLLAGAGIFGVALGFGAQSLIKDLVTGLSIVLENIIAIGDIIQIGTQHTGVVESMSMRTLRLRDLDGALHIIPFSEATKVINLTRDYGYAVVNIHVSYQTDLRKALELIRQAGEDMRINPAFKNIILDPPEILGVEEIFNATITLKARIRTRAGSQWDVKREFLLTIKERFEQAGLDIPYTTTISIRKEPEGG